MYCRQAKRCRIKTFSIKDFLQSLPSNNLSSLWESLLALCLATVDKLVLDEEDRLLVEGDAVEILSILDGIICWIQTYITNVKSPLITDALIQLTQTLHGKRV